MEEKYYEKYPAWIVLITNILPLVIYLCGAIIMYKAHLILLIIFLLFVFALELKIIKTHCVDCYYYGKTCAFGKGRISSLFFKKGNQKSFCKKITWKDVLPDFAVSIVPIIVGIILLIKDFEWLILIAVILLFILTFAGNAIVRTKIACKYCKQRKLGCPAEKLFNKS